MCNNQSNCKPHENNVLIGYRKKTQSFHDPISGPVRKQIGVINLRELVSFINEMIIFE